MNIIWQYLDKRSAAINALKDYNSMAYIMEHTDDEIAELHDNMTSIGSPSFTDMPRNASNPLSAEIRLTNSIDEIDVLCERYRQAKEYMDWFQPAWDNLSQDERFVLEQFYWEDDERYDALSEVCDKYNIERTSAYKKKNRSLAKLTLLLFGK